MPPPIIHRTVSTPRWGTMWMKKGAQMKHRALWGATIQQRVQMHPLRANWLRGGTTLTSRPNPSKSHALLGRTIQCQGGVPSMIASTLNPALMFWKPVRIKQYFAALAPTIQFQARHWRAIVCGLIPIIMSNLKVSRNRPSVHSGCIKIRSVNHRAFLVNPLPRPLKSHRKIRLKYSSSCSLVS